MKRARRLIIMWAAMWLATVGVVFALPVALLVVPLIACAVGGFAIEATHRALRVRSEMPGVPFIGPLGLCSLDDRLERLAIPNVLLTHAVVAAVFAPIWALLPLLVVVSAIAGERDGEEFVPAMFALVLLLFAASRIAIAFRVVRVLNRVEAAAANDSRHVSHVLPVAV